MSRIFRLAALSLVVVFGALLGMGLKVERPMRLPIDPSPLVFETSHGARSLEVEIADTQMARERGLMFRRDFPRSRAMLFVFDQTRDVMMWMQNTPLSLDMIFIGPAGKITSIRENTVPFSTDIISSGGPARFAVEVDAGVARHLGLEIGDRVHHPVIDRIAAGQ